MEGKMSRKYFIARIVMVSVLLLLAMIGLILRMYHIQIERHAELFDKAKKTYTSTLKQEGKRGEIYDIKGNLLVGNKPCVNIAADPEAIGDNIKCMKIADYFSKELKLNFDDVYKRLSTKKTESSGKAIRYVVIKKGIDLETADKIKKEVKDRKYKGLIFENKTKRFYPKNKLLANILGFINVDGNTVVPEGGIEKAVNANMSPTATVSSFERSRKGVRLPGEEDKMKAVQDGSNVYLTISEPIQMIVEDELDKLMQKFNPDAAYAVMVDPYTGNIMAMAQRPSFDPNDRAGMDPKAWRNRITEDTFDPGSIMKSTIVAAALDMGFVTPDTLIDCENGRWLFCGKVLGEAAGHGHKIISVTEIIRKSSNVGTAKIGVMIGKENVYKTMLDFGFGQKTGIPLNPEAVGRMRTPDKWDGLTISRYPIGQGFTVTPLQMARAYCVLANGGKLVDLRLIDRQKNTATGEEIRREIISRPGNIFKSKDTHREIVDMLKLVTKKGGTAEKAAVKGYEVAGKTGTAQKLINGVYSDNQCFASFVGFVPADKPAFVLLVTADNPQPVHYGGLVAAPAFSHIAKKTLRFLNVAPEYETTEEEEDDDL
jgi:cell division protein FtsI/penicillin-binding protein 2